MYITLLKISYLKKEYLKKKLDVIQDFNDKILDFYRYYRSGATYLDAAYFVRGQPDTEQYLETFYYERDPQFSTNADFKVAKIMANDMLEVYLKNEIDKIVRVVWQNIQCPELSE